MDYAPDYHNYVSDITRMWPASGKFSPTERELLGFVLAYRNAVMQRIRPGVTPAQIREEAKVAMQPVFTRTKFSKPARPVSSEFSDFLPLPRRGLVIGHFSRTPEACQEISRRLSERNERNRRLSRIKEHRHSSGAPAGCPGSPRTLGRALGRVRTFVHRFFV